MGVPWQTRERERERDAAWLAATLPRSPLLMLTDCRRRWRPAAAQVNVVTSTGDAFEDDGEEQKERKKKKERERAFLRRDSRTGARPPAVSTDLSHASLSLSRFIYLSASHSRSLLRMRPFPFFPSLSLPLPVLHALDNVVATEVNGGSYRVPRQTRILTLALVSEKV